MSKTATPTTATEDTVQEFVVSSNCSSSRVKHRPHPESTAGDPAPKCHAVTRDNNNWQLKASRQCIFYDHCTRCFPTGGDDA